MGNTEAVEALKDAIAAQRGAVVAEYRGMTVAEMTALRKKLREAKAEFKVVKNTMIRLAAAIRLRPKTDASRQPETGDAAACAGRSVEMLDSLDSATLTRDA